MSLFQLLKTILCFNSVINASRSFTEQYSNTFHPDTEIFAIFHRWSLFLAKNRRYSQRRWGYYSSHSKDMWRGIGTDCKGHLFFQKTERIQKIEWSAETYICIRSWKSRSRPEKTVKNGRNWGVKSGNVLICGDELFAVSKKGRNIPGKTLKIK